MVHNNLDNLNHAVKILYKDQLKFKKKGLVILINFK